MFGTDNDPLRILGALSQDNQRMLLEVFGLTEGENDPEEQFRRIKLAVDLRKARRRASAH
jgi:hypothetical protein